ESSWHNNVISAARSRRRETASATRTTSPSGAGTSTCVRCTPVWARPPSVCASARPACAAAKSSRRKNRFTTEDTEFTEGALAPSYDPVCPPNEAFLLDRDQLHVEDQRGVLRDLRRMSRPRRRPVRVGYAVDAC